MDWLAAGTAEHGREDIHAELFSLDAKPGRRRFAVERRHLDEAQFRLHDRLTQVDFAVWHADQQAVGGGDIDILRARGLRGPCHTEHVSVGGVRMRADEHATGQEYAGTLEQLEETCLYRAHGVRATGHQHRNEIFPCVQIRRSADPERPLLLDQRTNLVRVRAKIVLRLAAADIELEGPVLAAPAVFGGKGKPAAARRRAVQALGKQLGVQQACRFGQLFHGLAPDSSHTQYIHRLRITLYAAFGWAAYSLVGPFPTARNRFKVTNCDLEPPSPVVHVRFA